jgi:hypothetical protein
MSGPTVMPLQARLPLSVLCPSPHVWLMLRMFDLPEIQWNNFGCGSIE